MKLKHWMESLSRARKKSKNESSISRDLPSQQGTLLVVTSSANYHPSAKGATDKSSASSRNTPSGKRLSVKEIIMPSSSVSSVSHTRDRDRDRDHHPARSSGGERKYVRDNYPAVAAYLDHRNPLSSVGNLRTFRPASMPAPPLVPPSVASVVPEEKNYRRYERLYANLSPEAAVYATPSVSMTGSTISSVSSFSARHACSGQQQPECGCYRHQSSTSSAASEHSSGQGGCRGSENCMEFGSSGSGSGTLNSRRVNIRTNPWIVPTNGPEMGSSFSAPASGVVQPMNKKSSVVIPPGKGAAAPIPPPKPERKRPPPTLIPAHNRVSTRYEEESSEMVVCSDKSVGTDGDEYLFEESNSSCCDCEDCCSSSCTSFSSLKFSSGPFFSTDTIQPCDSDTCSITSTPTILNDHDPRHDTDQDFDDEEADAENTSENNSERDSAVDSPGSLLLFHQQTQQQQPHPGHMMRRLPTSSSGFSSHSSGRAARNSRHHYSPADSHTSWKYFDEEDDDEVDSGMGQTASSLCSPGSAGDYSSRNISHSSSAQSANLVLHNHNNNSHGRDSAPGSKRVFMDDDTREEFVDIDSGIDIIRMRLQKQVCQLKHEQTALDWQMLRSMEQTGYNGMDDEDNTENMIEEDFIVQKKAILAETLDLLKRQLEEQNCRLKSSHQALQNLQRRQAKRQEPRNRDCRALNALYNQNIRETFC
ncbi:hypothetical protein BV898_12985 [Hypsibius exemplaris]|uniref:Uncharacterized protein n=1 Tax=Hypsibius exemplaris TaxID=2072580 RepID=A0A1W0WC18_HYPEX|nr:hypothetical protein BV898_12985 [Hypsibius exemplaris]